MLLLLPFKDASLGRCELDAGGNLGVVFPGEEETAAGKRLTRSSSSLPSLPSSSAVASSSRGAFFLLV